MAARGLEATSLWPAGKASGRRTDSDRLRQARRADSLSSPCLGLPEALGKRGVGHGSSSDRRVFPTWNGRARERTCMRACVDLYIRLSAVITYVCSLLRPCMPGFGLDRWRGRTVDGGWCECACVRALNMEVWMLASRARARAPSRDQCSCPWCGACSYRRPLGGGWGAASTMRIWGALARWSALTSIWNRGRPVVAATGGREGGGRKRGRETERGKAEGKRKGRRREGKGETRLV